MEKLTTGQFWKDARVKANYSQTEVAKKLGYNSAQYISNFERGVCGISLNIVKKLVDLYKADVNEAHRILMAQHSVSVREALKMDTVRSKASKKKAKKA